MKIYNCFQCQFVQLPKSGKWKRRKHLQLIKTTMVVISRSNAKLLVTVISAVMTNEYHLFREGVVLKPSFHVISRIATRIFEAIGPIQGILVST